MIHFKFLGRWSTPAGGTKLSTFAFSGLGWGIPCLCHAEMCESCLRRSTLPLLGSRLREKKKKKKKPYPRTLPNAVSRRATTLDPPPRALTGLAVNGLYGRRDLLPGRSSVTHVCTLFACHVLALSYFSCCTWYSAAYLSTADA